MNKCIAMILGSIMMPITAIIIGALMLSGGIVILYSKIMHKDETKVEKAIESIAESNIENALNLPSGSLEGKLDFMVQPIEEEPKKE
jgi:hypothetical protein